MERHKDGFTIIPELGGVQCESREQNLAKLFSNSLEILIISLGLLLISTTVYEGEPREKVIDPLDI
ncbi:hypothetical protein HPG69_009650 [Diceros bicornis minor]|uniref:Uncharacterized protein n=1 Tax=Diceros bicornis minor TaxID=77932 RepID=A0A7J7EX70_DICBM|nr:hypothetical protein HPG69_009650 [Diceros bicornis minor]